MISALPTRMPTRRVRAGNLEIGGDAPISVQSMCATRTRDIDATVAQIEQLRAAGAALVRIAVDNPKEVAALREIRRQTDTNLVVDLQENYRLAAELAPHVEKIRYNPGHLHHLDPEKAVAAKVTWICAVARDNDCAVRIGVNCGSVAPEFATRHAEDPLEALVRSALFHCDLMDRAGFDRYVVSLKDSNVEKVIEANRRFAELRPDVPLHLGLTEAGMPPEGVAKSRLAIGGLLARGIGDTLRVSLTLPNDRKHEEVSAGRRIIEDVSQGRFVAVPKDRSGLNIIACPSCSRVENERFIELAEQVRTLTAYAAQHRITIAVMGCRVNGPGETDAADLGLWCGPSTVNLKRGAVRIGTYGYGEGLRRLCEELDRLLAERAATA